MIAEKMMIDSMVGIMAGAVAGQGVNMKRSCRAAWIVTSYFTSYFILILQRCVCYCVICFR